MNEKISLRVEKSAQSILANSKLVVPDFLKEELRQVVIRAVQEGMRIAKMELAEEAHQKPAHLGTVEKDEVPTKRDEWCLQDYRGTVGNDMSFWAEEGGYTTDLSKAKVFTAMEAFRQNKSRPTNRPWPKSYLETKTRTVVDFQHVKQEDIQDALSIAKKNFVAVSKSNLDPGI